MSDQKTNYRSGWDDRLDREFPEAFSRRDIEPESSDWIISLLGSDWSREDGTREGTG